MSAPEMSPALAENMKRLEGLGIGVASDLGGSRVGKFNPYASNVEALVRSGEAKCPVGYAFAAAVFPGDFREVGAIDIDVGKAKAHHAANALWFEVIGLSDEFAAETGARAGDFVSMVAASPDLVDPSGEDKRLVYIRSEDVRLVLHVED